MKGFWEEEFDRIVEKHGDNPKYFWKILYTIKLKNKVPTEIRGNSPVEAALKIAEYWQMKKEVDNEDILSKKEKDFIKKIIGNLK